MPYIIIYISYTYHHVSHYLFLYIYICIHNIYKHIHFIIHTVVYVFPNTSIISVVAWCFEMNSIHSLNDYFARGVTLGPWQVSWAVTVGRTRYKLGHLGERNRDRLVNITPILLWFMIRVTDCNCSIHGVKLHPLIAGGPTLWVE